MFATSAQFRRRLLHWYEQHRRDLPWRLASGAGPSARLDPYHVLLSEAMLQQTQVATVVPYFHRFIQQWPTLRALADADEQQVLRLWQGLGYYSRARNLHAAAKRVEQDHGGQIPSDVEQLRKLPGVGRYTAGAVASIAFGKPEPLVDGNVARVICRLDCIKSSTKDKSTLERLWRRAKELLDKKHPGDFNSAMMELGAMVCTPRAPQCLLCPVRACCQAWACGMQEQIPRKAARKTSPLERRWTVCVYREPDHSISTSRAANLAAPVGRPAATGWQWLIEQRPARGRWAGMWQFTTLKAPAGKARLSSATIRQRLGVKVGKLRHIGLIQHALTHRRYEFQVYVCACQTSGPTPVTSDRERRWVTLAELDTYPLPQPQVKVVQMLIGSRGAAGLTPAAMPE